MCWHLRNIYCILSKNILMRNSYWTPWRIFLNRIFSIKCSTVFFKFYILGWHNLFYFILFCFGVIFAQLYLQPIGFLLWDTWFLGFKHLFLWQFQFSLLFWGVQSTKILELQILHSLCKQLRIYKFFLRCHSVNKSVFSFKFIKTKWLVGTVSSLNS